MDPVTVTTRFDEATLRPAAEAHLRHRNPWFLRMRWVYLIGLAALGAWFLKNGDQPFGFVCLILSPVLFARRYLAIHRIVSGARTSPRWEKEIRWTFEGDRIRQESEGFQATLRWQDLFEAVLTPKLFLLYPQKQIFYALPRAAFSNEAEVETVARHAGLRA